MRSRSIRSAYFDSLGHLWQKVAMDQARETFQMFPVESKYPHRAETMAVIALFTLRQHRFM